MSSREALKQLRIHVLIPELNYTPLNVEISLVFNKHFEHPVADLQAVMAHEAENRK